MREVRLTGAVHREDHAGAGALAVCRGFLDRLLPFLDAVLDGGWSDLGQVEHLLRVTSVQVRVADDRGLLGGDHPLGAVLDGVEA